MAAEPRDKGPARLTTRDADFETAFAAFVEIKREAAEEVGDAVAEIIAQVRREGDAALFRLTARFDDFDPAERGLAVGDAEVEAALAAVPRDQREALELAAARIADYHERQRPEDLWYQDDAGNGLGYRWTPVDAAGLYVPGGLAAYPSSVLMNAIPARIAGVRRLVMVVPMPGGEVNPLVLAAAKVAGIGEIYRVGGAQAVAALAYGTESIAAVDKIVGPGNAYVAEAKRQVFGAVGIDSIAGPSEVLVVADGDSDPRIIAADLLAQAEHDTSAQAILITDDEDLGEAVARAVEQLLQELPRAEIAGASWRSFGAIIQVSTLEEAPGLINRIAPEHLELAVADPDSLLGEIRHAGAIFLGRRTPEAIGDYVGGPNHVLPTARTARYASGLSILDFMKRTTLLACSQSGLDEIGGAAEILARAEGLDAHALSVRLRRGRS
jgi:histidinol dehydrogenase